MEESQDAQWWSLHLRVARGEPLSPEEQQSYSDALTRFDAEERLQLTSTTHQQVLSQRARIESLEGLHAHLIAESKALDSKIEELEVAYQQLTGYVLVS